MMSTIVTTDAGSLMSVVNTNVTSAMPAVASASSSSTRLPSVSARIRRWPMVTMQKTRSATAEPIDAIAERSLPRTRTRIAIADTSRPICTRPPAYRRAMIGGNWPVDTRWSVRPIAG